MKSLSLSGKSLAQAIMKRDLPASEAVEDDFFKDEDEVDMDSFLAEEEEAPLESAIARVMKRLHNQ